MKQALFLSFCVLLALSLRAQHTVVFTSSSSDNTLYEDANGTLSNGAGQHFFAGRTGQPAGQSIRRGLVKFNVSDSIPAGATITSVALTLNMSQGSLTDEQIDLHRVMNDWGEAASDAMGGEGGGAAALSGDATWVDAFSGTTPWQEDGGDFAITASASLAVGGDGNYTWSSNSDLIADVQNWIDNPTENYGWLLKGNESAGGTAKRFDSKENGTAVNWPQLSISYLVGPDCGDTTRIPGIEDTDLCGNQVSELLEPSQPYASYLWSDGSTSSSLNVTEQGVYSLTVVNSLGCTYTQQAYVNNTSIEIGLADTVTGCLDFGIDLNPQILLGDVKDSITIIYDATQGVSGLIGASSVYMHSGAETAPFQGWEYVTGNWGQDDGIGQMTSVGTDLWSITIHPQSYYNMPAGTNLNGLFMVFRNAQGTATGKDWSDLDIFINTTADVPFSGFSGVSGDYGIDSTFNYLWSTGETSQSATVFSEGLYALSVQHVESQCISTTSVQVVGEPCPDCSVPTNTSSTNIRENRVDLNWDCDSNVYRYVIRGNRVGSAPIYLELAPGCQSPYRVSGLASNRDYFWQVMAICNAQGTDSSDWSAVQSFTSLCRVPTALSAINITDASARIEWNGVPGASAYTLRGRRVGGNWVTINTPNTAVNTGNILDPLTTYEIQVSAQCTEGNTLWSPVETFMTQDAAKRGLAFDQESLIQIYPNPATDVLNLKNLSLIESGVLKIYNLQGELILSRSIHSQSDLSIDVSSLENGLYRMSLSAEATQITRSIVISR